MPASFSGALVFSSLIALFSSFVDADTFTVQVLDKGGKPLSGAVVELKPMDSSGQSQSDTLAVQEEPNTSRDIGSHEVPAIMDQVDRRFEPYILVVQEGDYVHFPNSDSIKHHVYSFSAAKSFQLRLYRDKSPEPLQFDEGGIVPLGCNIHDWMIAYIYVAQSSWVGQTQEDGAIRFDAPTGRYHLTVWHPGFDAADLIENAEVQVSGELIHRLTKSVYIEKQEVRNDDDLY